MLPLKSLYFAQIFLGLPDFVLYISTIRDTGYSPFSFNWILKLKYGAF